MDSSVRGQQDAAIAFADLVAVTLNGAFVIGSEPLAGALVLAVGLPAEGDVCGKAVVN